MAKDKNKYTSDRLHDYIIMCDTCGGPWWASECKTMSTFTGKGGSINCPRCADPINPGLVPYKIRPERPVSVVRVNNMNSTSPTNSEAPFDYSTISNTPNSSS
jgi:hypothetical protein